VKLQAKKLIALCALFTSQWFCLKIKNWPDNLPMTNRNCFCFCYVTTRIIFDFSVNNYQTKKYFLQLFGVSYTTVCCTQSLSMAILNTDISQGSVATQLRCGEMFNNDFIENLPVSLTVKEFWKSVSIWRNYGEKSKCPVFWFAVYMLEICGQNN